MSESGKDPLSPERSPRVNKAEIKEQNLDVINLSSQLTSMQILSKRKAKKRVRFELPDQDNRPASSQDFVTFQKLSKTKHKKFGQTTLNFREGCSISDSHLLGEGEVSNQFRYTTDAQESHNLDNAFKDQTNEEQTSAKRVRLDITDVDDSNNNNSFTANQYTRRKMLRERQLLKKRVKTFKINLASLRKVVSKFKAQLLKKAKKRVRQEQKRRRSAEESKSGCSLAKKSKSVHKYQSKLNQLKISKRSSKTVKGSFKKSLKQKRSKSFSNKASSGGKSNKTIKPSGKAKRSVMVAKSLKKKAAALKRKLTLKRQHKVQAAKRLDRKKAELKRKLAEKRKKKQSKTSKACQNPYPRQKKPKKPRFIPIIREEDVCNSMCTSLLIYRTIQRAKSEHLHCCEKKCWRDWEELDLEDVYIDYE